MNPSGLPASSGDKVYRNKFVFGAVLGQFIGQLGPFFAIFFGTKGPDGEWPYAWWSFGLLGGAIAVPFATLNFSHAKVVRTQVGFTCYNLMGNVVNEIPLSEVVSIQVKSSCFGEYIALEMSDKNTEERKQAAGCCACFEGKQVSLCMSDMVAFKQDHGLTSGGQTTTIGSAKGGV